MAGVNMLMMCMHLNELNCFFLKNLLWIPPANWINIYRILIWVYFPYFVVVVVVICYSSGLVFRHYDKCMYTLQILNANVLECR